jgi:hypothetical protein
MTVCKHCGETIHKDDKDNLWYDEGPIFPEWCLSLYPDKSFHEPNDEEKKILKVFLLDGSSKNWTTSRPWIVVAEDSERAVKVLEEQFESWGDKLPLNIEPSDMQQIKVDTEGVESIDCNCL